MADKKIGKISHYYDHIGVAVVDLSSTIKAGETIKLVKKDGGDLVQTVESMEVEHEKIDTAKKGQSVGLKVNEEVRKGSVVYKVG